MIGVDALLKHGSWLAKRVTIGWHKQNKPLAVVPAKEATAVWC
jgi:hypothetical protein